MSPWLTILLTLMLACGCAVGPDYQRPDYPAPADFRGLGPDISKEPAAASFGDLKWFEVFKDDQLQEIIRIALQENYDVQIAAQRVLAAREQVVIQRAFLLPSVNGVGQVESLRTSIRGFTPQQPRIERTAGLLFCDLVWELDFFGRLRRATAYLPGRACYTALVNSSLNRATPETPASFDLSVQRIINASSGTLFHSHLIPYSEAGPKPKCL